MRQEINYDVKQIPISKIAIVATSNPDYSMDRTMLVEDFPSNDEFVLVSGNHCSCYGFEEVQWDAQFCTRDEVIQIAQGWLQSSEDSEKIIAPLILEYLESK